MGLGRRDIDKGLLKRAARDAKAARRSARKWEKARHVMKSADKRDDGDLIGKAGSIWTS